MINVLMAAPHLDLHLSSSWHDLLFALTRWLCRPLGSSFSCRVLWQYSPQNLKISIDKFDLTKKMPSLSVIRSLYSTILLAVPEAAKLIKYWWGILMALWLPYFVALKDEASSNLGQGLQPQNGQEVTVLGLHYLNWEGRVHLWKCNRHLDNSRRWDMICNGNTLACLCRICGSGSQNLRRLHSSGPWARSLAGCALEGVATAVEGGDFWLAPMTWARILELR